MVRQGCPYIHIHRVCIHTSAAAALYNRALKGVEQHPFLLVLVVACLGLALGTVWEIVEWVASQVWRDPNLREGRLDVITDLLVDGIGSLLGAVGGIAILQRSQL